MFQRSCGMIESLATNYLITILSRLLIILLLVAASGCTVMHGYGPYSGRVVDQETGSPITGAVVFLAFYTEGGISVGGLSYSYAGAVETETDTHGEFKIDKQWVFAPRFPYVWEPDPDMIVYKYGYSPAYAYSPIFSYAIPQGEHVIINLSKSKNEAEAREMAMRILPSSDIPKSAYPKLLRETDKAPVYAVGTVSEAVPPIHAPPPFRMPMDPGQ
ncbi:MAG: hypothetical protein ACLGPL_01765 [Acidobacteriota bacterium]